MLSFFRKIILVSTLLIIPLEAYASSTLNRLARSPYDIGIHVGIHTTCSFVASSTLRTHNFTYPYWKSAAGCLAIGVFKEQVIDDKPSMREYGLNVIGILIGSALSWTYEDYNFSITIINPKD